MNSFQNGTLAILGSTDLSYVRGVGGCPHKWGYPYARTARVWFLPISVLERSSTFWPNSPNFLDDYRSTHPLFKSPLGGVSWSVEGGSRWINSRPSGVLALSIEYSPPRWVMSLTVEDPIRATCLTPLIPAGAHRAMATQPTTEQPPIDRVLGGHSAFWWLLGEWSVVAQRLGGHSATHTIWAL